MFLNYSKRHILRQVKFPRYRHVYTRYGVLFSSLRTARWQTSVTVTSTMPSRTILGWCRDCLLSSNVVKLWSVGLSRVADHRLMVQSRLEVEHFIETFCLVDVRDYNRKRTAQLQSRIFILSAEYFWVVKISQHGQQSVSRSKSLLKPNSITLAGSELVRSWFEAGSYQIPLH